jgi:hypothetical protein
MDIIEHQNGTIAAIAVANGARVSQKESRACRAAAGIVIFTMGLPRP